MNEQRGESKKYIEYLDDAMPVGREWQALCCHYSQELRQNIGLSLHYKDIIYSGIEYKPIFVSKGMGLVLK